MELWNTKTKKCVDKVCNVPLSCGEYDIRETMTRLVQQARDAGDAHKNWIDIDHEIRVTIMSPDLPPMNLLDLPGIIEAPEP